MYEHGKSNSVYERIYVIYVYTMYTGCCEWLVWTTHDILYQKCKNKIFDRSSFPQIGVGK